MKIRFVNHARGYIIVFDGEKDVFCLFGGYRTRYQRANGTWADAAYPVPRTISRSATVRLENVYYDSSHKKWTAKSWSIAEEDCYYAVNTAVVKVTIEIDGSRGDKFEDVVFVGSRDEATQISRVLCEQHGVQEEHHQVTFEVRDLDLERAMKLKGGDNAEHR